MKAELAIRLFSRWPLTESMARNQITALAEFEHGLIRPDKCGEVEPIKSPFDLADIREPIRWLAQPHGSFMYRKGSPVCASGVMWNRAHPSNARFPSPVFTNYWTGEFDGRWANRVGIDKIQTFVSEMFQVTGSDFALLTTEDDLRMKNRPATSYSYEGLELSSGIPGLYWMNFFSAGFAAWLGLSNLPKELAASRNLLGGGVSLTFGQSLDECRSREVLRRQHVAIEWLGAQRFFDVRFPDRKMEARNWEPSPDP